VVSSARIQVAFGRTDLAGQLVVEEARTIGVPMENVSELRVRNAFRENPPGRHLHDLQRRSSLPSFDSPYAIFVPSAMVPTSPMSNDCQSCRAWWIDKQAILPPSRTNSL